jgi:low temperature requirement protein LtrA
MVLDMLPVFVVVSLILGSKYSVTNPKELSLETESLLVGKFPILYRTQQLFNKDTLTFKVLVSHVLGACIAAPQATYFIYLGNKVT